MTKHFSAAARKVPIVLAIVASVFTSACSASNEDSRTTPVVPSSTVPSSDITEADRQMYPGMNDKQIAYLKHVASFDPLGENALPTDKAELQKILDQCKAESDAQRERIADGGWAGTIPFLTQMRCATASSRYQHLWG